MFQNRDGCLKNEDYGPEPMVLSLERAAERNHAFRSALWTGTYFQITLMCIPAGADIGLEIHEDTDQLIGVARGCGMVRLGRTKDTVCETRKIGCHDTVIVPAGTWHNVINCGSESLKMFSVYAPPHHPFGTFELTKPV